MVNEDIFNAKILIVDDHQANILLLAKLLKVSGYRNMKTITDSRETVRYYLEYQPDLILLDYKMPYLDGFQVLELLNEVKGEDYLSVVIVTAQNDLEHRILGLEKGAKDFISKPFDHAEVLNRIHNMLEIRLLHNQVKRQNQELEDKVQERTKELRDLQLELIYRLLRAAEFRDNETGDHITRMSKYSFELGKAAGLSEKENRLLLHACTMHDIGKIGVPDEILLKPGKLNDSEWEKMKSHTVLGGQILTGSSSELIQMAEIIALSHHEKWDGSGYPRGLKGEEIPLVGRITAICDVFDALISERPYKNAWGEKEAVEEIKNGSGTHFDPFIVEAFLKALPAILKIKEEHA
ncbi:MAG: response regulator [Peptococcaceae bacterium]|nr:response regulator [Peptococcaceae bacterium]